MPNFALILAAAGRSSRFGPSDLKKPFLELNGRAIWLRALDAFTGRPDLAQVLISLSPEDLGWFQTHFRGALQRYAIELVPGGKERADSVQNALNRVRNDIDFVAVHDAARPLLKANDVDRVFAAAQLYGAVIPVCPMVSTVKRVAEGTIVETVSRADLWQAQTPQTFRRELLQTAYAQRGDFPATDESQLVERLGHTVHVVECSARNLKITTPDDFQIAKALLSEDP